jgi:hypothetical protein
MTAESLVDVTMSGARVILWGSAIYHAVVGTASCLPSKLATGIGTKLYGLKITYPLDAKYDYTLKPLGAYALFTAGVCSFALMEPSSSIQIAALGGMALLYGLRALFRVVYFRTLNAAYAITMRRNLINVAFNTTLTLWLIAAVAFTVRTA